MKKRILSVLLAILMVVSIIPMSKIESSAANGIQEKIDLIRTIYDTGSYFTSDGKSHNMLDYSVCPADPNSSSGMPYKTCKCSSSQITKKTTGVYSSAEVASKIGVPRWQCCAFASFVFYNIFNKDFGDCGTVGSINDAKLGDVVEFKIGSYPHYGIFLYNSGSNVYVYDANSDYNCKVVYGSAYAKSLVVKVFRASNYDSVNGSSTPTPSINYVTGLAGQYYLQNKNTGYWLAVSEGKDASTQPINTWSNWGTDFRVKLVASGNGYKMNFPNVSSLLVNPYSDTPASGTKINLYQDVNDSTQWWGFEKVGDAYAIRCLYNPSLVLTSNGTNQATLTTYTGATNQLWYIHPYTSTVTYNANGGSGAPGSQTKYFNETLTLSSTKPTRSGYTFLGWSTSSTATSATYSAGGSFTTNANTTLYAVWSRNSFTVSYNANNGTGAPAASSHQSGSRHTVSSTIPERFGCTFLGWGPSATQYYWPGESFTVTSDITLYAIWAGAEWLSDWQVSEESANIFAAGCCKYYYIEPSYTRTYHFESTGSVDSRIAIYDSNGNELAFNDDSGEDYNFSLNFTAEGGKKYYVKIYAYSDNTGSIPFTVSPCWNVTYDANGGTGAPETQNKIDGEALTLSTAEPTRTGYTFLGWSTSSSATSATYSAGGSFTTDADTTLYAVWKINTYTVSYDANGGTGAPPSQTKTHGAKLTLSSIEPTREGYTFLGWTRYPTTQTVTHVPGGEFITNADTTLYALWEKNAPVIANQWAQDDHGWRYYDANGEIATNQWVKDNVGWCYVGADGYCLTNSWKCDINGWCYLDANGRRVCNKWLEDKGKWYFLDINGYMLSDQWKKDSIGWCYLGSDGAMLTNSWVKDSVGWCYVGANGYCVTNKWVKDSHGWCYLDANGRMATNQWIKDSVGWCYVGADGYCLTNSWVKDSKGWCYLDANGRMVYNKWVKYNGQWYYLDANGYMVTGTKVIGGKTYKFNSSGVWIG